MQKFSVTHSKGVVTVNGNLGSLSAPAFQDSLQEVPLTDNIKLDFTGCVLFSTACLPPLKAFISRAKRRGSIVTCVTGDALRRTLSLTGIPLGIKRLDPETDL